MFETLPSVYQSGPNAVLGIDVELRVDVNMSKRDLLAPIQLAVHALRLYEPGEEVMPYGGLPLHNDLIRRVGHEMRLPFACSHARSINNTDFSFDGLPFAWMIHRPVPGSKARLLEIANRGVACLLPHLRDGYTAAEKKAFADSPLGYMVNSASIGHKNNLKIKWRKVGTLYEIPVLTARRRIEPGEQLLCPYNNEEQRQWAATERISIDSTSAAAAAPARAAAAAARPVRLVSTAGVPPSAVAAAPQRQPFESQSESVRRQQRRQALIDSLNGVRRAAAAFMADVDEEAPTEPDDDGSATSASTRLHAGPLGQLGRTRRRPARALRVLPQPRIHGQQSHHPLRREGVRARAASRLLER